MDDIGIMIIKSIDLQALEMLRKQADCDLCRSSGDYSYSDIEDIIGKEHASKLSMAMGGKEYAERWYNTSQFYFGGHKPSCMYERRSERVFWAIDVIDMGDINLLYS